MAGYSGGYTRHSVNDVDVQAVSITSVDLGNNVASGITKNRTALPIDISHHVGAVQVTPSVGEQWYIEKYKGNYRLKSQIPYNNAAASTPPTQGQAQLGSGSGPIQLHGTQINSNGPLRLSSGNSPLPGAGTVDAGSLMYDPAQQKPVFSDGNSWIPMGTAFTPYDINYIQTTVTRAVGYGTNPMGVLIQRQVQFTAITFRCGTASASGNLVVEVQNNGVTVAGTSTTIPAAQQVSGVTITGSWGFGVGDILTVYISAVGTSPGIGLSADFVGVLTSASTTVETMAVTATATADALSGELGDVILAMGAQATADGKLSAVANGTSVITVSLPASITTAGFPEIFPIMLG